MYEKIQETASWLKARMKTNPKTAIILGTGLGQLASEITDTLEFPYSEIPNFPVSTVEGLSDEVRKNLYVLPARITFLQDQEEMFNQQIIGYVRKNSRNSILAKVKNDVKPKDSHHSGDRPRTISFRNN